MTEILRDVCTADLANLSTKADIARLKARMQCLEAATKADFQRLEDKMEIMRRDMTIRLGGMIVAAAAILLAAKFFG